MFQTEKEKQDSLSTLQKIFECVQECLEKYEGVIRQFIIDDKGAILISK